MELTNNVMKRTQSPEYQRKMEWAKELYTRGDCNQKEIAQKIGINEKTIGRWIEDEHWNTIRTNLMTTKSTILHDLYATLEAMKAEAKKFATDDDPSTKPDTDGIYKLTLAIKKLETQTGIGEMIDTGTKFIKFIQVEDLELAKQVTKYFDLFIDASLKAN